VTSATDSGASRVYLCGIGARWLPRVLGGAVLGAGLLAVARIGAQSTVPGARSFRGVLVVFVAIVALWIVRKGSEVRLRVRVDRDGLSFEHRGRSAGLAYADIDAVRYEAPFGASRAWLPAAILSDRREREWRLCALIDAGDRLLAEVVERSGRDDLAAWVEAQRIVEKMSRSAMRVRVGYALAAAITLAGVVQLFR